MPVQSSWKGCSLAQSPFQKLTKVTHPEAELAAVVATKNISVAKDIAAQENAIVESVPMVVARLQAQESTLTTGISS